VVCAVLREGGEGWPAPTLAARGAVPRVAGGGAGGVSVNGRRSGTVKDTERVYHWRTQTLLSFRSYEDSSCSPLTFLIEESSEVMGAIFCLV